ncbi:MAG: hypothetical protein V7765_16490, partial [Oleispira sp.]
MYALKVEEFLSSNLTEEINKATVLSIQRSIRSGIGEGISENIKDNYDFSFTETADQLADQITTLAGQINAATYRFLKLIAEFDRRNAWAGYGLRSCAHWLNWKCGIAMSPAREKVRTARV